ncbi:response regulator [Longimicrobium terrae]|uniref:DNA-binding NarL/FixJ family response regulator n=1 Tax=Longimicrobium terrae TaxID=1639882 RepID=A0A841H0X1_9BACT|nr:response regulator transcription factor [Longimicrobium terrae]MBB4637262.1 DNA-binding NarL/FixJ family response regulator [Longimicrobium terrae]MBB6071660.1 DNA-binding NarL/FixJ family response regulator [Longimicrobium terrae]NNC28421.1 response regulator transcription factor [Longimicrobium terrae]
MSGFRILLGDDHELVLEGLRSLVEAEPDMRVIATATNGRQVIDAVRRDPPDVVVMDLEMGEMNGLRCLEVIKRESPGVRVLVLTAYGDGESMRAALEGGADGFALKTEPPQQTVASIRQVCRGQLVFPLAARKWLLRSESPGDATTPSARETEILALVSEGLTNAQIAHRLRVSDNTVKFHLQNLYLKLGVRNRTEATAWYLREGRARRA